MTNKKVIRKTGLPRTGGVYAIVNLVNGKSYIGSTKDLAKRWSRHRSLLLNNEHYSPDMQRDFNEVGLDGFEFKVLEHAPGLVGKNLRDLEQKYLDRADFGCLYNYCVNAHDWRGTKHRPGVVELLRQRVISPSIREKLRACFVGRSVPAHIREKISKTTKGRSKAPEHRQKLAEACSKRNLANSKHWIVWSPDGVMISIKSLNAFCKSNGLNQAAMQRVACGKAKQHKGWKCSYSP